MVGKWELIGLIQSSSYRKRILKVLHKPKTPSQLEKELNIKISHISRTLKELKNKKLVQCRVPNLRKGRFYEITKLGKEVIKNLT